MTFPIRKSLVFEVGYKTCHADKEFTVVNIKRNTRTFSDQTQVFPSINVNTMRNILSNAKVEAIKSMLHSMPLEDQNYYRRTVTGISNDRLKKKKSKPN